MRNHLKGLEEQARERPYPHSVQALEGEIKRLQRINECLTTCLEVVRDYKPAKREGADPRD